MDASKAVEPVRKASREMVRELGMLGDPYGKALPPNSQTHILIELGKAEVTASELGSILRLEKSTVSRILAGMRNKGWVTTKASGADARRKLLVLTVKGRKMLEKVGATAASRVKDALLLLDPADRSKVAEGLKLYSRALRNSRLRKTSVVRPIRREDDRVVASIIRRVMTEFGACGQGFAINDPEVDFMTKAYNESRSRYFVLEIDGEVVGGAGVAPLTGGNGETCELRKMYLVPKARGTGAGQLLFEKCVEAARSFGFAQMYLETLHGMKAANRMYHSLGFRDLQQCLGQTGHSGCDRWMVLSL